MVALHTGSTQGLVVPKNDALKRIQSMCATHLLNEKVVVVPVVAAEVFVVPVDRKKRLFTEQKRIRVRMDRRAVAEPAQHIEGVVSRFDVKKCPGGFCGDHMIAVGAEHPVCRDEFHGKVFGARLVPPDVIGDPQLNAGECRIDGEPQ